MSKLGMVVLLGPPGSGKGTQARTLSIKHPTWMPISTGDLFRSEIASESELGISIKSILASGKLVSDEITNQVFASQVQKIVKTSKPSVLLIDGFPRTRVQAEFLLKLASAQPYLGPLAFVEFKISETTVVSRVADRLVNPRTGRVYHRFMNPPKSSGICDDDGQPLVQREDDKPETIRSRFKLYESQLSGITSAIGSHVELVVIDAEGEPDRVGIRLENAILNVLNKLAS